MRLSVISDRFQFACTVTLIVLGESSFWFVSALSSIDYNGKTWIVERKRNQKLLSPSTIIQIDKSSN